MECTEGKLEENQTCINCIDLLSKEDGSVVAQIIECDEDELSDTQRANAQELVRRWNAFEEDGLVDELRAALKDLINYHYHNDMGVKPKEYHRAIAAIAKAT